MPRGGGGGFRGGGGFSGGGFRGGSLRSRGSSFGGGRSFRSGFSGTHSRPFGRTGASRNRITRRGPYHSRHHSHHYRRSRYHRRHWYRPYYRYRWFYRPWWAGHYYNPWYRAPGFICGGFVFLIAILFIILPLFISGLMFPFAGTTNSGEIQYSSSETLYYNEYWYEYEKMQEGGQIQFDIQSSPEPISFAIANHPFKDFPEKTVTDSIEESILLPNADGDFHFQQIFLHGNPGQGSTINFQYNASSSIQFFIADIDQLLDWNEGANPNFPIITNSSNYQGTYEVEETQDYYLVWYNPSNTAINVDYDIDYQAIEIIDFSTENSGTLYSSVTINEDAGIIDIPTDGTYYFFIFFDPFYSPAEITQISFNVRFFTNINDSQRWRNNRPILIILGIIGLIVIISVIRGRKKQKEINRKKAKSSTSSAAKKTVKKVKETPVKKDLYQPPSQPTKKKGIQICSFCGAKVDHEAVYCTSCGRKLEGRSFITPTIKTPKNAPKCYYCGEPVPSEAKFCPNCGGEVEE